MIRQEWNWDSRRQDESASPDGEDDRLSDDWDEAAANLLQSHVWDAFELDDLLEDPEPEHGDFWPEPDEEEQT